MRVAATDWKGWKAVSVHSGDCELIIGTSAGPRILSLRYQGGPNLLYEDYTNFKVEDWFLYGGHRFTIAPEAEKSYEPDNDPCTVEFDGTRLVVSAALRTDKLRLAMEISPRASNEGFHLHHTLYNESAADWTGALWAITCIPRSAEVKATCTAAHLRFWPETDPANWLQEEGGLRIGDGAFRGKAGWHQQEGELIAEQPGGTLLIRNSEASLPQECVDEGCNREVFACPDWIELETLGKRVTVGPGGLARHQQEWRIFPGPLPDVLM